MLTILILPLLILLARPGASFFPVTSETRGINLLARLNGYNVAKLSETLTHEEILRRGVLRSVAKYFNDQNRRNSSIVMDVSIRYLYKMHYGKWYCHIELDNILKTILEPNVGIVDSDPATKTNPTAHFDAETFVNSNSRVMNYTALIYDHLGAKDYDRARVLTGRILHTIHDFYSHSNWVEMGKSDILRSIGTEEFLKQGVVDLNDTITCASNCTLVSEPCTWYMRYVLQAYGWFNKGNASLTCPLTYYKCKGNIVRLDKLVTGFTMSRKKPPSDMKCSHGGILDKDSFRVNAVGGINKDSGYYLFSPHAELHLLAANLAIKHVIFSTISILL